VRPVTTAHTSSITAADDDDDDDGGDDDADDDDDDDDVDADCSVSGVVFSRRTVTRCPECSHVRTYALSN
jgi:hypothetical protein